MINNKRYTNNQIVNLSNSYEQYFYIKKIFNNNYNDTKKFAVNEVILQWLAFQKQENEFIINANNYLSRMKQGRVLSHIGINFENH